MTRTIKKFLIALLMLGGTMAWADEGRLIALVGNVSMVRDGAETPLGKGALLRAGDLVKVGTDSLAQLRMSDQSILALGPRTEFLIAEYRFSADKPAEGKAFFSLLKGALRTVTGIIGRESRENYAVKAGAIATIGIRGTHYRLRLCDGDCVDEGRQAPTNGLYGGVTEGLIGVTNETGTTEFGAEEHFYVADATTRPVRLHGPPDPLLDRANFLRVAAAPMAIAPVTAETFMAPSEPGIGPLDYLSALTLQQFRPADIMASTDALVHVNPIVPGDGGFINVGGSGEIRGQIIWMTNADIDLHMLAPSGGSVYYGNPTLNLGTATATLDHDNLGGTIDAPPDKRIENIIVTGTQIPTGLYNFSAYSFSGNNNGLPTTVQIRVTGDGNATALTDTVTLGSRQTSNGYIVDYRGAGVAPVYSTQITD